MPRTGARPRDETTDRSATGLGTPGSWLARLTLERVVLVLGAIVVFAVATRPATDPDLWWHLRSGQWMVQHHAVLRHDPFSATRAGAIRQPTDWLSEIGLYGTWVVGGLTGVALLVAAFAGAGIGLVWSACRGPALARGAIAVLAAITSSVFWSARPQMVTFLFTAVVVWAMVRVQDRSSVGEPAAVGEPGGPAASATWLWWLVPLFALWSNLHLGWFYGLVVLGAVAVGEAVERWRRRRALDPRALRTLVAVTIASAVAVMANPVGPRVWSVVLVQVRVGRSYISENQPPRITEAVSQPFFVLLLLVVVVLAVDWRRVRATEVLLVVGTGVAALSAVRTVPLFATAAAPVAAAHLAALLADRRSARPAPAERRSRSDVSPAQAGAVNLVLVAVLTAAVVVQTRTELGSRNTDRDLARHAPVAATAWVAAHRPPGALFNTFDWGGYLIWKLRDHPVWIDGRADLYTKQLETYRPLIDGHGWRPVFAADHIRVAILPTDAGISHQLAHDPSWRIGYHDTVATVFVHR